MPVTASMLYNFVQCPHRVGMDLFADPADRDSVSPFVKLLWERGARFEKKVIEDLDQPFIDLSGYSDDEKEQKTMEAIERGEDRIYSGRISADDLLGEPDLLFRSGGGYIAGDIKSGAGEESSSSSEERKPKKHYAVQLALYTDILERLKISAGRHAFVWDIHGEEVPYLFNEEYGKKNPRTLWQDYQEALAEVQNIVARAQGTLAAYSSECKHCVWYSTCLQHLKETDDLTLIPGLGRAKRDVMLEHVATVQDFAVADPESFVRGKKTLFPGVGSDSLAKFHARAQLLSADDGQPYLRSPVTLPAQNVELFFDIEVDSFHNVCYLHGFVERRDRNNESERFVHFFAEEPTEEQERRAFSEAVNYIREAQPCSVYYYSHYDRTWWCKLCTRHPGIITEDEINGILKSNNSADLLNVVRQSTEWPTNNHTLKTLASYLGFEWRDTDPSGAASIEWYYRWVEERDEAIRQRILEYNEDDCRATRVLLDGIRRLSEM